MPGLVSFCFLICFSPSAWARSAACVLWCNDANDSSKPPLTVHFLPALCALCSEPGYYSPATAKQCTICPAGQYSPTSGLADQNPGNAAAAKCLLCPAGSLALSEAEDVDAIATLTTGATTCEAW